MTLQTLLSTVVTDQRSQRALRALSQLSDATLEDIHFATGMLPPDTRAAIRSFRLANGRGPCLMRLLDGDTSRITDAQYRTLAYAHYLAAAVMLSNDRSFLHCLFYIQNQADPVAKLPNGLAPAPAVKPGTAFTGNVSPDIRAAFSAQIAMSSLSQFDFDGPEFRSFLSDYWDWDVPKGAIATFIINGLARASGLTNNVAKTVFLRALADSLTTNPALEAFLSSRGTPFEPRITRLFYHIAEGCQANRPFEQSDAVLASVNADVRGYVQRVAESGGPSIAEEALARMALAVAAGADAGPQGDAGELGGAGVAQRRRRQAVLQEMGGLSDMAFVSELGGKKKKKKRKWRLKRKLAAEAAAVDKAVSTAGPAAADSEPSVLDDFGADGDPTDTTGGDGFAQGGDAGVDDLLEGLTELEARVFELEGGFSS